MATTETFYEVMRRQGISRRSFLKYCSLTATALGLAPSFAGTIANAMETKPRTPVIWLHGLECTCCSESFIRSAHPLVSDVVLSMISLDYDDVIMASAGHQAEAILDEIRHKYKGNYILAVEGNVPLNQDGMSCIIGGRPFVEQLREVAADCQAIIAWGSCASWGCVQAAHPNPTQAVPIHKVIHDKPIIKVPGCPPIAEVMTGVITYLLTFERIPELDRQGRPKMFYGQRIHDKCYRRPHFDAGQFVEALGRRGRAQGLLPLQDGLQGSEHLQRLLHRSLEQWGLLPDPVRSRLYRLFRGWILGQGQLLRSCHRHPRVRHRGQCGQGRHRRGRHGRRGGGRACGGQRHPAHQATRGRASRGEGPGMSVQTPNGFQLDNTGRRIVVDPVTRIEGHMRCEVNLDENNVIRNAVSTGTMWRGLEVILRGRDPRDAWAFTERICGVCTGTHALTSVRAVEDALGIQIPENANSIRNIMQLTLQAQDHLVHFYHLHALDWVDVVSALSADPKATSALAQSISDWPLSSPGYFRDVQNRVKRFVESGQLGPFMNGYWGNPAYKLPPEANLMAVTHYLEALDFQKEIVKIHTIYGGKNPHPNWLVGGVACAINVHDTGAVGAINMERLNLVSSHHRPHHRVHRQGLHPGPARDRLLL